MPNRPKKRYPVKGLDRHGRKWRWRRTIDGDPVKVIFEADTEQDAIAQVLAFEKVPHLLTDDKLEREAFLHIQSATAKKSLSKTYSEDRMYIIKKLGRDLNIDRASHLTATMINRWISDLRKTSNENTIHTYLTHVSEFTKWLKSKNRLYVNPMDDIEISSRDFTPRDTIASRKEIRTLIDAAKEKGDHELELILLLGFECGMRHGEISAARPEWVNLQQRNITIPAAEKDGSWSRKGRSGRKRAVTIEMVSELHAWFSTHGLASPYLLKPKKTWRKHTYRYEFRFKVMKHFADNGLPDLTIHDMRRSFGSNRVMAGRTLLQVANWMGIHPSTAWKHYARFVPASGEIEHGSAAPAPEKKKKGKKNTHIKRLKQLMELFENKLITKDEYHSKRAEIIKSI